MMIFILPYFILFWYILGSTNILSSLIGIELLSWVFIQLLIPYDSIKYLVVQSIFFLFSMMSLFWVKHLLILGFLLKAGLPPFHMWMMRLLSGLKKSSFIIILTLHKFMPLLLLAKIMKEMNNVFILSLLMTTLSVVISNLSMMFMVLGLSSMIHSFWMVLSSLTAVSLLSTYWIIYAALSWMFIYSINSNVMKNNELGQTSISSMGWLLMSGIPPFTLFWLKAHVSLSVLMEMSLLMSALFLLNSVLALSAYYRTWHFSNLVVFHSLSGLFFIGLFFLISSSISK